MKERKEGERSNSMKMEFVKMYKHRELGVKLNILGPEEKGDDCLREMEKKVTETKIDGIYFKDLRESLVKLKLYEDDKSKNSSIERLDMLGHLGRTPAFMMQPPKGELVEKHFHPLYRRFTVLYFNFISKRFKMCNVLRQKNVVRRF
ncbi:hypothetical protein UlMin_045591 [Ulmus minor]